MFLVQDNAEVERMLSLQRIQDAETEQFWRAKHSKEEGIQRVVDMQENPTRHSSAVIWRDPNPAAGVSLLGSERESDGLATLGC
jgi:hypothetical protein